ncbi:MAG: hypothetical protein V2I41_16245 [Pseudomonadales bacterium]|nr:hypothetical protein [Pseudomonadales bacterium]
MESYRIIFALGLAFAVHAVALWWWSERPVVEHNKSTAKIELVLTQISRPPELVQPDQAVEEVEDGEILPDPGGAMPPEPAVISQPAASMEATPPSLDLTSPDNWAEVAPMPDSAEGFVRAFRGEFYQRLEQRQISQARSQFLSGRRVAQRGLPADQYNALEQPGSGHYKTAAGCFDLKPDIVGTIGGGQRAWMSACKDLIRSPFELPSVEFDALGRAVGP